MKINLLCANESGLLPTEMSNRLNADLGNSTALYVQWIMDGCCRYWVACSDDAITLDRIGVASVIGESVDEDGKKLLKTTAAGDMVTEQVLVTTLLAICGLVKPTFGTVIQLRFWSPNDSHSCLVAKCAVRDAAFQSISDWATNITISARW
jgi:hypothetical protein